MLDVLSSRHYWKACDMWFDINTLLVMTSCDGDRKQATNKTRHCPTGSNHFLHCYRHSVSDKPYTLSHIAAACTTERVHLYVCASPDRRPPEAPDSIDPHPACAHVCAAQDRSGSRSASARSLAARLEALDWGLPSGFLITASFLFQAFAPFCNEPLLPCTIFGMSVDQQHTWCQHIHGVRSSSMLSQ